MNKSHVTKGTGKTVCLIISALTFLFSCRREHACLVFSCAAVCTSIQVACLRSLRANQVESLNQDPAMHVNSLLCANEAGYVEGWEEERERGAPHGEPQVE